MATSAAMPAAAAGAAASGPRPLLHRIIFGLALWGIFLVTHLHMQQTYGFNRGCLGLAAADPNAQVGCEVVTSSGTLTLFGIPNVVLGLLFYGVLAALRFAMVRVQPAMTAKLRLASLVWTVGGFAYALYLVGVQAFQIGEYCVLCLVSAATVTLLFGLHIAEWLKKPELDAAPAFTKAETRRYALALLAVGVLSIGDVVAYATINQGNAPMQPISAASGDTQPVQPVQPSQPAPPPATAETPPPTGTPDNPATPSLLPGVTMPSGAPLATCTYDREMNPIRDMGTYTSGNRVALGARNAPVTVIKFFDPNCPHCRDVHTWLMPIIEAKSAKAKFYFQPYPIWQPSIPQVQAMYIAREQGKFYEMIEAQIAMIETQNKSNGLTVDDLAALAGQIGLDGTRFRQQLTANAFRDQIMTERTYMSDVDGVTRFPRLSINGRFVANTTTSMNPECVSQLIDQAYTAATR